MLSGLFAHTLRFSPKNTTSLLSISGRVPFQCHRASHQLLCLKPTPPISRTRLPSSYFSRLFSSSQTGPTVLPTGKSVLKQPLPPRFFSSNGGAHWQPDAQPLPVLSTPAVANWLFLSSTLVFAVIVVGGVTRLTESGLSITEWRPITGVLPPLSLAEWENEFEKYKATPEFRLLNSRISLDDFKSIYYMEWAHRILGRTIGLAFVLPLGYFALQRRLSRSLRGPLLCLAALLGAQGVLGWYMVQSGLEPANFTTDGAVPRVSQYRLAAHLSAALVLYAGMFAAALAVKADWRFAHQGAWGRLNDGRTWEEVLRNPIVRRFKRHAAVVTGLVLFTALSGAFVAGLDAGLLYNEFPLMGGRLSPPLNELLSPHYATPTTHGNSNSSSGLWRNLFENPTTVQFDHRVLAMTTYIMTALLFASSRNAAARAVLPPSALRSATSLFAMANVQVLLGISTLLYLVPVPLAAAHQAGSVALLTAALHVLLALRRPGAAALVWRKANSGAKSRSYYYNNHGKIQN